jgi:glutamine---fructose-6-phosphate transaminase (isomerizing)
MKTAGSIMGREIAETPSVYRTIFAHQRQFESLQNLLLVRKIHTILILARGTSDNAAFFLKYLIETRLGLPVGLASPSVVSVYGAKLNLSGTLVIAISQSGQSPDLLSFGSAAKSGGAVLLTMVNATTSPLENIADYSISLNAGDEVAVAATKSYSAQLIASYLLVSGWANSRVNESELLAEAEKLLALAPAFESIASKIDLAKQIVILGRGYSFPNAKEAALKIQETCKTVVQSWSIADYIHGPISSLDHNSQVIIIAPAFMPKEPLRDAVSRLRPIVDRITWLGQGGLVEENDFVIPGSMCEDSALSSIVDAISIQLLTLALSKSAGFDPDVPAGLSKVTLTL